MALVVFRSKAAGEIFMFAETARRILDIIGKPDAPRGVISAEQIADALARLTAAVEEEKEQIRRAQREQPGRKQQKDCRRDEAAPKPPASRRQERHQPQNALRSAAPSKARCS